MASRETACRCIDTLSERMITIPVGGPWKWSQHGPIAMALGDFWSAISGPAAELEPTEIDCGIKSQVPNFFHPHLIVPTLKRKKQGSFWEWWGVGYHFTSVALYHFSGRNHVNQSARVYNSGIGALFVFSWWFVDTAPKLSIYIDIR